MHRCCPDRPPEFRGNPPRLPKDALPDGAAGQRPACVKRRRGHLRRPPRQSISGQAGSRGKSGYFAFVDLVDLIGVEKLLGVAQIDLLANEYVEQIRVDVSVQPEVPENLERFGKRL